MGKGLILLLDEATSALDNINQAKVLRVFPDYRKWNKWLKDNGHILMQMRRDEGK